MINEKKVQNSFRNAKRDIDAIRYESMNALRFLNVKVKEQDIRIKEMERRLAQVERLAMREVFA